MNFKNWGGGGGGGGGGGLQPLLYTPLIMRVYYLHLQSYSILLPVYLCDIFFDSSAALAIHFTDDSPRVTGNTMMAEFSLTRPVHKVTCHLSRFGDKTDCEFFYSDTLPLPLSDLANQQ